MPQTQLNREQNSFKILPYCYVVSQKTFKFDSLLSLDVKIIEYNKHLQIIYKIKITKFQSLGFKYLYNFFKNVLYHMQQKIQKLFTFFRNIKNEPFYTSCIAQIIEVYENCPESLKFILYNMKQLLFVSAKESNLRFKHRKICASIISKLNIKYVNRVHAFLSDKQSFQIQSFQLDSKETKTDFTFKTSSWQDKNYIKILQQSKPLYSSSKDYDQNQAVQASSQKTFFEQFHEIKQATMMNMEQLIQGMKLDEGQEQSDAYAGGGKKYQDKIKKFKQKNEEKFQSNELFISNPFNLMFQICLENMLSPQWQLRHLSVLIIKQIIANPQFLGFMEPITIPKMKSPEQRFNEISNMTRNLLAQHLDKIHIKKAIFNEVCQNAIELLCLDRFADYQSDSSNIIVRAEGAEILKICFQTLEQPEKLKMLKLVKKLLDLQPSKSNDYTWQLRHSFIYFLSLLTQRQANVISIYKLLDESLFRVLSTNQTDQITLCVCQIFNKCVGQSFFNEKAMKRVNQQLWNVIQQQDDIAVATKQVLSLLKRMFCVFDLSESDCLDKIKKFFVSKIPEVRKQLYSLLVEIFARNFTIDVSILDKNLILFMQAIVVQNDEEILQELEKLAPEIMKHILKNKKLGRVNYFISSVLLDQQYLSTLIQKHFKVYEKGTNLASNDYLYLTEEQRITVSLQLYMDRRCSKAARILAKAFNQNLDGLQEIVKYTQNQRPDDKRATMFIFNLYCQILKENNSKKMQNPYFKNVLLKASQLLNLDVNKIDDPDIKYQKSEFINSIDKIIVKHQSLKDMVQHFKKSKWDGKQITIFHQKLCSYYNSLSTDDDQLKYSIALLTNITDIQKKLFNILKVLACYFIVKVHRIINQIPKNDISKLINSLAQAIQQERYTFLSEYLALSLVHLSELLCIKKNIKLYQKITKRFIKVLSSNYKNLDLPFKVQPNNFKFTAGFMEAGKQYILMVGKNIPTWIDDYQQYILEGLEYFNGDEDQLAMLRLKSIPSQGQSISMEGNDQKGDEDRNPLRLLSGVIQSLLALDSQKFLTQLLKKLDAIIDMPETQKNYSLLCKILQKMFLYFAGNYTNNANIFFSWYLDQSKKYKKIFYVNLSNLGLEAIVKIAPVCSLFIMQIVRSISIVHVQDIAMGVLSNLLVGVYVNFVQLPFSPQLLEQSKQGVEFVKNFKEAGKFNYQITVKLDKEVQLRNYQLEGISWLGFLTKYNLNGALCDDMGLGKTIQMLILIQNQYHKMVQNKQTMLQSLIVVPTTIMQHWKFEYYKYFSKPLCKIQILQQSADLVNEQKISPSKQPKIFITNYNFLDKNIAYFSQRFFKFIVLDEGHIIKNIKTKKFKSVKKLKSLHRFILTGTPIQNRLKQLWGLFDFLMPGYLYTEEIFNKHYQKLFEVNLTTFKQDELLFSENQRKTLQKLHFKVMPFIMRRMKTEVLKELPSKIINDYYCQMTKTQQDLYSEFYENSFGQKLKKAKLEQGNILKSLIEMQKILNHPSLVGGGEKFQDSGKFLALAQLFEQLGLTETDSSLQNKVIVFSRSNKLIELLQSLFMKAKFPNIKYLKLTGNTKVSNRFSIAQTFNGDIDIKVLLVTTKVGGEGLNLCSANTVIMFDHDYNPTVDMQAIDRAHRIGQRRVVNVYRLITKDTLQEKIMGIQKFKTNLANAIVNIDNASIKNIKQSKLPDLLEHIRDQSEQTKRKVDKSFVHSIMEEIQKNAITQEDYKKKY